MPLTPIHRAWGGATPEDRFHFLADLAGQTLPMGNVEPAPEPLTLRQAWHAATVEEKRDLVREWFAETFARTLPGGH